MPPVTDQNNTDAATNALDLSQPQQLTFGEKYVGLSFNPSNDPKVQDAQMWAVKAVTWTD